MYPAIGNVKEGRLPEEAIEIALSEDALQYLGLDAVIGDTVSLDLSVSVMDGSLSELEYSADFVLTGILESSYIGYASGTVEGIVGEGTAEELLPEEYLLYSTDFKTYDKQNFQSIIYALAEDLNVDERYIQYNWVLLDATGKVAFRDGDRRFFYLAGPCGHDTAAHRRQREHADPVKQAPQSDLVHISGGPDALRSGCRPAWLP